MRIWIRIVIGCYERKKRSKLQVFDYKIIILISIQINWISIYKKIQTIHLSFLILADQMANSEWSMAMKNLAWRRRQLFYIERTIAFTNTNVNGSLKEEKKTIAPRFNDEDGAWHTGFGENAETRFNFLSTVATSFQNLCINMCWHFCIDKNNNLYNNWNFITSWEFTVLCD